MPSYRKAGKSPRDVYKVDGDLVIRVLNKEKFSRIDVSDNRLIRSDALDEDSTKECTESEFNEQYQIALDRINKMRIE